MTPAIIQSPKNEGYSVEGKKYIGGSFELKVNNAAKAAIFLFTFMGLFIFIIVFLEFFTGSFQIKQCF